MFQWKVFAEFMVRSCNDYITGSVSFITLRARNIDKYHYWLQPRILSHRLFNVTGKYQPNSSLFYFNFVSDITKRFARLMLSQKYITCKDVSIASFWRRGYTLSMYLIMKSFCNVFKGTINLVFQVLPLWDVTMTQELSVVHRMEGLGTLAAVES